MSALTLFKGCQPLIYDVVTLTSGVAAYQSTAVIDAAAEKIAFIGTIWHPTVKTGSINIRKVHFRTGAITFNVLSTVRVSLQTVSSTAGPPYQPDGTQDQTYDFALGVGLAANTWTTTGNLSTDRVVDLSADSVADVNSRWVAVVFEYQTFTAADSIVISTLNMGNTPINSLVGGQALLNTASWALLSLAGQVVAFECDDGTFAFMEGATTFHTISTASIANNTAIRAAGLKFRFPVELTIDTLGLMLTVQNIADGDLILYDTDGTTVLRSIAIDNDAVASTAARHVIARCEPVTLTANSYYRLVFVASVTTATLVSYVDFSAVGMLDGMVMGQDAHWTQRDSAGTWADTTTRRPLFGLRINSVHDGVGGGSGVQYRSNMSGNV